MQRIGSLTRLSDAFGTVTYSTFVCSLDLHVSKVGVFFLLSWKLFHRVKLWNRKGGEILSLFPMNLELVLQLLSITAVIAVGPAIVVLLFAKRGNL